MINNNENGLCLSYSNSTMTILCTKSSQNFTFLLNVKVRTSNLGNKNKKMTDLNFNYQVESNYKVSLQVFNKVLIFD